MKKILIIDDDDVFRVMLSQMLERQGFKVLQASAGAQGVQLARAEAPDLILCDVEMRGVNGNLVLCAVRHDPQLASMPFVLMSGFAVVEVPPQGNGKGPDDFLAKPFTPTRLASSIEKCLGKREKAIVSKPGAIMGHRAGDGASGLKNLLNPVKQVLEATGLIGAEYERMELKEIVGLANQAHLSALLLCRGIENCLAVAQTAG